GRRAAPHSHPRQRRRRPHPPAAGPRARSRPAADGAGDRGILRRGGVPPRDRRLHGAGRRPDGHGDERVVQAEPQGRVLRRAPRPRRLLHGAHQRPEQRQQSVLHLPGRRALPRPAVHSVGSGRRRHGVRGRAAQGRAAAEPGQDRQSAGGV
ncbi:MAG: Peptidyl-prolyl cis-trans isomerase, partial [uncultured Sphingomonadaceae bacterium]